MIGREVATGEVDVFATCLDGPKWMNRLVGEAAVVENKWRGEPTSTDDISIFHDKAKMATATCKICYFISMSGFTSARKMGAEQLIHSKNNPKMVGWDRENVERMVADGTVEQVLRGHTM